MQPITALIRTGSTLVERAVDWLFGYDFFLSYSHGDGLNLPRWLKERLEAAGFRVFLDQTEYVAGVDLRRETGRQVRRSRKIVIVARPHALMSDWVRREADIAVDRNMVPVLVDVNGAVEDAPPTSRLAAMARERHWLRLPVRLDDPDDEPPDRAVAELVRGFGHTRQNTKRQRAFAAATAVLAVTTVVATWQAIEARRQQQTAERNFGIARDTADGLLIQIAQAMGDVDGVHPASLRRMMTSATQALETLGAAGDDPTLAGRCWRRAAADAADAAAPAPPLPSGPERRRQAQVAFDRGAAQSPRLDWIAERDFREALTIWRGLLSADPSDEISRSGIAAASARIAEIALRCGAYSEARKVLAEAFRDVEAASGSLPSWATRQLRQPRLILPRDFTTSQVTEMRALLDSSVEASRRIVAEGGFNRLTAPRLGHALVGRADYLASIGQVDAASADYREGIVVLTKIADLSEGRWDLRRDRANAERKLAKLLVARGDTSESRQLYGNAAGTYRELLQGVPDGLPWLGTPDMAQFRIDLADCLSSLAAIGDGAENLDLLAEARVLLDVARADGALNADQFRAIAALEARMPAN